MRRQTRSAASRGPHHEAAAASHNLRLQQLAYASIALLLAGGVFAMAYLFMTTTRSADELALHHERALVSEALQHRLELEARHQTFVAVNDTTTLEVQAEGGISPDFARTIAREMWLDFDQDWTLIVNSKNNLVLAAAEDEVVPMQAGEHVLRAVEDLVAKARQGYRMERRPAARGYRVKYVDKGELAPIYATDLRHIDGAPALVSAMAIVPESDNLTLPDGPPSVLVSVILIEEKFLAEIGETLLLKDFTYAIGSDSSAASVPVSVRGEPPLGYFEWTSAAPGKKIRNTIGPIAAALIVGFVVIGIFLAHKLARKSRALEESEARNRNLAMRDVMTGLANRSHFGAVLDEAIARCHETPCAVMAIDLDRFKAVNDTYGHEAGDMVIRQVSRRLNSVLADHGLVARAGGDEFLALITDSVEDNRLRWLCDALIEEASKPIPVSGGLAEIGVSIGWAVAPDNGDTSSHLLSLADQALYHAKESGRNTGMSVEDIYRDKTDAKPGDGEPDARRSA